MKSRKQKNRDKGRKKLSMIVDVLKAGFGNTNERNTARKAFANANVFAEITGVQ